MKHKMDGLSPPLGPEHLRDGITGEEFLDLRDKLLREMAVEDGVRLLKGMIEDSMRGQIHDRLQD